MLGLFELREALFKAEKASLDLVEISPNTDPPVCKIMDFGKFKYEAKKRASDSKKKQKQVEIKEIKLRPTIGEHDLQVKLRSINKFIEEGDKVKITLRFKGREITHQEVGMEVMQRVITALGETVKIDTTPKMEGPQLLMMVSPK